MVDFDSLKSGLHSVLEMFRDELSISERQEVTSFIDVGEYGLALETLSALLVDERKGVSSKAFDAMVQLADEMGIREGTITDELKQRVLSGAHEHSDTNEQ